jgi:hypothetical protein
MEQKFVKFEEALDKLGVSAEVLNELRERGELRAYRDGASWKFRADEIDRMATEGVPEPPPPSDIGLVSPEDLVPAEPLAFDDEELDLELDDDDEDTKLSKSSASLKSHDDSELELELSDTDALSTGSELELAGLEDTVTAETSDLVLEGLDEPSEPSDSILLSEEELGESVGPHASTIIGKSELADADLQLGDDDDDDVHGKDSDVRLASSGASDVLSSQIAGSGVLDTGGKESSSSGRSAFEDLDELEIDLAAESSRILSPEDVQAAKAVGKSAGIVKKGDSDLKLGDDDDEPADENNQGSTDVPLLELESEEPEAEGGSGSEIELSNEEDLVLSDSGGSDITLDSGDSGINLVAPSDSGLALDDIPLDIGGSAILSSLSLSGDSDPEISLVADDSRTGKGSGAALQTDDDFQLTPMSDKMKELEGDSSSQVIALDADLGDLGDDAPMFDEAGLTDEADDGVVLSEDFGGAPAGELGVSYAPVAAGAAAGDFPYSVPNILALSGVTLLLFVSGVMMLDIVRNIWSWQESYSVNSDLLDALLGMFGLQ